MSDLIRREDVMGAILRINVWDMLTGDRIAWDKMLVAIYKAIENIPSADPMHCQIAGGGAYEDVKNTFGEEAAKEAENSVRRLMNERNR